MVRRRNKAKVPISIKSHEDDLPAETGAAEIDVSKSMIVDASENNTLSQSEYLQTAEEAEKENNLTLVGSSKVDNNTTDAEEGEKENNVTLVHCSKVDNNTIDAAEDEHIHEEYVAEEVEMELGEAKEEEEGLDDYGDDVDFDINGDYDDDDDEDDDDFDEGEEALDDDDGENIEVDEEEDEDDEDDGEDDDDDGEEDENDDLMEEEEIDEITKLENKDDIVKESDENQRDRVTQGKKEENVEENKEREGGSSKKKEKTFRKGKERKGVTKEVSDKVASKRKAKQEEDGQGDAMEKAGRGNTKEDIQDKEGSSKQKVKSLRKSRREVAAGGFEKVASKRDDKVESSRKKKVKSMGMIFMCSSKTKKDCYQYKVLGLPANKRDLVGKIYKGMRLFLYDVDLKLLYGIYKAAGHGGYNIQPKAFNSQFPAQVRFTVFEDCLPLAEEKFKRVIKDNYFTKTKFDCQLTSQQVKNLCKLFVSASKGSKAIRSARRVKTHASTDQDRSRERHRKRHREQGEERQSARAEKRRYHEDSRNREREVVAPPVAPVPIRLVPPAAAPPYAYDRTLERDAYGQDWLVEHRDSHRRTVPEPHLERPIVYRREPLLHQLDSYRRDVPAVHPDLRLRDEIGRRDLYISYRERPEHRDLRSRDDFGRHDPYLSYGGSTEDYNIHPEDEFRRRDPYLSFRELPAYRDRTYGTDPLLEPVHYRSVNRSEYRSAVAPLPEYRSASSLYRY